MGSPSTGTKRRREEGPRNPVSRRPATDEEVEEFFRNVRKMKASRLEWRRRLAAYEKETGTRSAQWRPAFALEDFADVAVDLEKNKKKGDDRRSEGGSPLDLNAEPSDLPDVAGG